MKELNAFEWQKMFVCNLGYASCVGVPCSVIPFSWQARKLKFANLAFDIFMTFV